MRTVGALPEGVYREDPRGRETGSGPVVRREKFDSMGG